MPFVEIPASPVAPARGPARIYVREAGAGPAVLLLHGGLGYEAYPFDAAIAALAPRRRVLAPDRIGYGRSGLIDELPRGFHQRMAEETLAVMDALDVREAALWGHSDGAVVAVWAALLAPERIAALVLEALHFRAWKPASIPFFETAIADPERLGPAVVEACRRDHGERWREVLAAGARAWLAIIEEGRRGRPDLFDGRAGEVRRPALLLHGRRDPRTEPGEIEAAARALPCARIELLDAGHAPHTSRTASERCVTLAAAFLSGKGGRPAGEPGIVAPMAYLVRFASTPADLDAGYKLRRDVFEVEQNIPRPLDRDPFDDQADHVVAFDGKERCVGTGRVVRADNRTAQIGRMAVAADQRKHGIGGLVLEALERMARLRGISELTVASQLPAEAFYRNRGFVRVGEPFLDQGVPHVVMRKSLRAGACETNR